MVWTDLDPFKVGTAVNAELLNSLAGNITHVKQKTFSLARHSGSGGNYTTSSQNLFSPIDNTLWRVTFNKETEKSALLAYFTGVFTLSAGYIQLLLGRENEAGIIPPVQGWVTPGMTTRILAGATPNSYSYYKVFNGLPKGNNIFQLLWTTNSGSTATLYTAFRPALYIWEV